MREKSDMQVAEEMQSGWLQVPRIGFFAFPLTHVRGGNNRAEERMDMAFKAARAQWTKGVAPEVEMVSPIYEPLEGKLRFNEWGEVEGPAQVTFPSGNVYEGQFKGGRRHGPGTLTFACGNVEVCFYEEGQLEGPGVRLEKGWLFGRSYWLLKDGKKVRKISPTEARSSVFGRSQLCWRQAKKLVKEHGLPELPW